LSVGINGLGSAYRSVFNIPEYTKAGNINLDVRSFIVEFAFAVLTYFIMMPLLLGMLEWYWNLTDGKKTNVGDIFAWYGSGRLYGKSLLFGLNVGVRTLLWGILTCGLPYVMIYAGYYYASGIDIYRTGVSEGEAQRFVIYALLMLLGILLLLGGLLLFVYIFSRYIPAFFMMAEDNERKVRDVVKQSIAYSRPYRWEYTKFALSYIGWFLLCIAMLPLIFVVPYFFSALSIFTKHIIYSQRSKENNGDTIQFDTKKQ
jgi:uncharacterized membrane protein